MEQFLQISDRIVRCSYTMNGAVSDASLFIDPELMQGTPLPRCPIDVRGVSFKPRSISRLVPDGEPEIRVIRTVDGQRTSIVNLREVFDREAGRRSCPSPLPRRSASTASVRTRTAR